MNRQPFDPSIIDTIPVVSHAPEWVPYHLGKPDLRTSNIKKWPDLVVFFRENKGCPLYGDQARGGANMVGVKSDNAEAFANKVFIVPGAHGSKSTSVVPFITNLDVDFSNGVNTVDVTPTCLDYFRLFIPSYIQGKSLLI